MADYYFLSKKDIKGDLIIANFAVQKLVIIDV